MNLLHLSNEKTQCSHEVFLESNLQTLHIDALLSGMMWYEDVNLKWVKITSSDHSKVKKVCSNLPMLAALSHWSGIKSNKEQQHAAPQTATFIQLTIKW